MKRIGGLSALLLAVGLLVVGCGGGEGSDESAQSGSQRIPEPPPAAESTPPPEEAGRPMIPPEMPEAVEGVVIEPYFDAEGKVANMAVAPGELFDVYVCAHHPGYDMATAQWRLEVPDGVQVLGEKKMFTESLSLGTHETLYIITYPCRSGEEPFAIVKYSCMATKDFAGGEFYTVGATRSPGEQPQFLGFVTCGDRPEQVPASGGAAVLTIE
jgi:hypothetical protein